MSWQSAKAYGRRWAERLPKDLGGVRVFLARYEDEATLRFLKPEDDWSLKFQEMVLRACAREVKARGGRVEFVEINLPDYWEWLERFGLQNTAANRAQFVIWKTAPEPKPRPLK